MSWLGFCRPRCEKNGSKGRVRQGGCDKKWEGKTLELKGLESRLSRVITPMNGHEGGVNEKRAVRQRRDRYLFLITPRLPGGGTGFFEEESQDDGGDDAVEQRFEAGLVMGQHGIGFAAFWRADQARAKHGTEQGAE